MTYPEQVVVQGPMREYAGGFCSELALRGYAPLSAANQVRVMAHLSRWLQEQGLSATDLGEEQVERFLQARRAAGYTCWLSSRGLAVVLSYLRGMDAVPAATVRTADTELDRLLAMYEEYLRCERGLAASTVIGRCRIAAQFVREHLQRCEGKFDLEALGAADIQQYVLKQAQAWSVAHAKWVVTALRSLLRFLYVRGDISRPLADSVPSVAGWRLTSIPRSLEPEQVKRLLGSCERRTRIGRRDYAILLMLARLGMRRAEVAHLEMTDIDWMRGEVTIRGKGGRTDALPLPLDVGQALEAYVRRGRVRMDCSRVFVRSRAPLGPVQPSAISDVVRRACIRAGLAVVGTHRLRHTAATQMLWHGSSLMEIGQVLRHRNVSTTAIYAKVDREALRSVAQPWPLGSAS